MASSEAFAVGTFAGTKEELSRADTITGSFSSLFSSVWPRLTSFLTIKELRGSRVGRKMATSAISLLSISAIFGENHGVWGKKRAKSPTPRPNMQGHGATLTPLFLLKPPGQLPTQPKKTQITPKRTLKLLPIGPVANAKVGKIMNAI